MVISGQPFARVMKQQRQQQQLGPLQFGKDRRERLQPFHILVAETMQRRDRQERVLIDRVAVIQVA